MGLFNLAFRHFRIPEDIVSDRGPFSPAWADGEKGPGDRPLPTDLLPWSPGQLEPVPLLG